MEASAAAAAAAAVGDNALGSFHSPLLFTRASSLILFFTRLSGGTTQRVRLLSEKEKKNTTQGKMVLRAG